MDTEEAAMGRLRVKPISKVAHIIWIMLTIMSFN